MAPTPETTPNQNPNPTLNPNPETMTTTRHDKTRRLWRRLATRRRLAAALGAGALLISGVGVTSSAFSSLFGEDTAFGSDQYFAPKLFPADPPSISGTPDEDQTLTAVDGQWAHATSFEYQWQACDTADTAVCADIQGATTATLTVPHDYNSGTALAGKRIRVKVTGVNGDKKTSERSAPTAAVRTKPKNTVAPAISGTAKEGQVLQVTDGTWDADPAVPAGGYTYRWQRCAPAGTCTDITNATSSSYTAKGADVEKTLRAVVTAENAVGPRSQPSAETAPIVIAGTSLAGTATISGTPDVGQTLTASSSWTRGGVTVDDATVTYQWRRCDSAGANCANVAGANQSTRTVVADDVGYMMRVVATASSTAGSTTTTGSATSAATRLAGINPSSWYNVIAANSNKCVEAQGSGKADGTPVQQWTCVGIPTQEWQITPTDSGFYRIENHNATGKFLDMEGGQPNTGNRVKAQLWGWVGNTNQQWRPVAMGNGYVKFVARHSGRCLDVTDALVDNGTRMQQYDCNGTPAQSFRLVEFGGTVTISGTPQPGKVLTASSAWKRGGAAVTDATVTYKWQSCNAGGESCQDIPGATASTYTVAAISGAPTRRVVATASSPTAGTTKATSEATSVEEVGAINEFSWYTIVHKKNGTCVKPKDAGTANDTVVEESTCAGGPSEQWQFVVHEPGWYRVYNRNAPNQILEISLLGDANGTVLYNWVRAANQQWKVEKQADGTFKLIARHSNKCLDSNGAAPDQLIQFDCNDINDGEAQKFVLIEQPSPTSFMGGWFTIMHRDNSKCVNARGGGVADGTAVEQVTCSGATTQQWKFEATDSGWYRVMARHQQTLFWDVDGGPAATGDGQGIKLWGWANIPNQQFRPIGIGDGRSYRFQARHSGRCIEAQSSMEQQQLRQWSCNDVNNSNTQAFTMTPAP